jgi:hypothetical protein
MGDDERSVSEAEKVLAWRLDQCVALGLPLDDAEEFAQSSSDLEQLRKLIAGGCHPRLAARILL